MSSWVRLVRTLTKTLFAGAPGKIKQGTLPADSDHDGMPDEFEDKYGLDKNNPADAMQLAANGYTNIENYLFLLEQEKMNK